MRLRRYAAASLIVLILYLVGLVSTISVFAIIRQGRMDSFSAWISLGALILAETVMWQYVTYWINHNERVKRNIPGFLALGTIAAAYLIAVFVYSFIAGIDGRFLSGLVLLHILTLTIAVLLGGAVLLFLNYTLKSDETTQSQLIHLYEIESGLKSLLMKIEAYGEAGTGDIKSFLTKLIEQVRFSDPVVPDTLAYLDQDLLFRIDMLKEELQQGEKEQRLAPESVLLRLQELKHLLDDRNARLLLSK
ncbi:Uncharacterised protein [Paenibacillus macerans]|uniref:Uncharacterized protein n=1 Tax=Paenibacillus macerans TaxID=44252 RepID=A0A090ZYI0_PAEMA|nr:hypothetical protein DJ90_2697 [Paenibacillus macerans]SUA82965.1 Uncharacterised protein [Paenibacillus macerans]